MKLAWSRPMHSTGMVQVFGTTYRISRVGAGRYQIVRIRDEVLAGSFSLGEQLQIVAYAVDPELMRRLVTAAVHAGKTSWMGPRVSVTDCNPTEPAYGDHEGRIRSVSR
jgi:hypothetical protein